MRWRSMVIRARPATSTSGSRQPPITQARIESRFGDISVPVIGFDHLIMNKRATGRAKDLVDAAALEQQQKK